MPEKNAALPFSWALLSRNLVNHFTFVFQETVQGENLGTREIIQDDRNNSPELLLQREEKKVKLRTHIYAPIHPGTYNCSQTRAYKLQGYIYWLQASTKG
jgi:hypothetical protein